MESKATNDAETRAWFDGAFNDNGAAYGFWIARQERVIATSANYLLTCPTAEGEHSSVGAEFAALEALLKHLIATGTDAETSEPIVIHGDCESVLAVVSGQSRSCERYRQLVDRITAALVFLPPVRFEWIPRSLNTRADALAREALKNYTEPQRWGDRPTSPTAGDWKAKKKKPKPGLKRSTRRVLSKIIDLLAE